MGKTHKGAKEIEGTGISLSVLERRFCEELMIDNNATQAFIRSGFNGNNAVSTAGVNASKLLKKASVLNYIEILRRRMSARAEITADYVVLGLKTVAERCMQKAPVMEFDPDLKTYMQKEENGAHVWEFDSGGANKAFELLGKHLGIFEKDNSQKRLTFNVAIVSNNKPSEGNKPSGFIDYTEEEEEL